MSPAKHFKKDPFFPSINILGYTDLDYLDFCFGILEGLVGHDVRKEWLRCYNTESYSLVFAAIWKIGVITLIQDYFSGLLSNDHSDLVKIFKEQVFVPDCGSLVDFMIDLKNSQVA